MFFDCFFGDFTISFLFRGRCNLPTAQLVVFGSSHNGFAFENSDLDISLTFSDRTEEQVSLAICEIVDVILYVEKRFIVVF